MRHFWRRFRPHKNGAGLNTETAKLLVSLLEQTPDAVKAQRAMDQHPGAYHTNKVRLYELIDFNDTFVDLALSLQPHERIGFVDRLYQEMVRYCEQVGSPMFTEEQYDAITRGLSREVAVYLGALDQGYKVQMTSRRQDAMGVDMVVTDPATGRSVNIDCKTPSAYHYRLKDLVQQGRLTHEEAERADRLGYVHQRNGHGEEAVEVTVLRIDPNEMGDIQDLTFADPRLLGARLAKLFEQA